MQGLNSNTEHPSEKYVRWIVPIVLIATGVLLFNKVAPTLIKFFDNVVSVMGGLAAAGLATLVVGLPLLYAYQNPQALSSWWIGTCRKITAAFVKMDPLAFMDAFIAKSIKTLAGLRRVKTILEGKKLKLERTLNELEKSLKTNLSRASAAKSQDKLDAASMLARKARADEESIKLYKPLYDKITKYLVYFDKFDESLANTIEGSKYEVEQKRTEFEMIKEMYKGLSAAEIFINSDNAEVQVFQMAIKALEEDVTHKMAYINDFEKRSKSLIDGIDINKQMMNDEGLKMLEEYDRKQVFGKVEVISSQPIRQGSESFAKLLRK
jgi:hypothetical protein